jgi:CBS domain-containing protein
MKPAFQIDRDVAWAGGGEPAAQGRAEEFVTGLVTDVGRVRRRAVGAGARVDSVMTQPVITVDPLYRAGRALSLADRRGVSHLPVCWSDSEILGMVCVCDLWPLDPDDLVIHHMSLPVITVGARQTLAQAAELMRFHDVGSLPVVDGRAQRLVGMITLGDLVRADVVSVDELPPACMACHSRHHVRTGIPIRTARSSATFCLRCLAKNAPTVIDRWGSS